jgi:hypothetical protein
MSKWPGVSTSTTSLIFFGTPFRGAEGMKLVEMLEAARSQYQEDEVQTTVLEILEPGNEYLLGLVDDFGETQTPANKAEIACFYELIPSDVGKIVGTQNRTVCSMEGQMLYTKLTTVAEIRGERKLWLP